MSAGAAPKPRSRPRRWLRRIAAVAIGLAMSALLLELTCAIAVHAGWIPARTPTYSLARTAATFWGDIDTSFGVWHYPDIEYRHTKACFDVLYRSNSYGARDLERERSAEGPRVVVLGDSFMEGYGVELDERLSGVLEQRTGIPHLNFGTSGNAGPTHAFLVYRDLASQFDHSAVLAAILPENDFEDDLPRKGRYQPYWAGTYPDYRLEYTLVERRSSAWSPETDLERIDLGRVLRDFTYTRNVFDLLYTGYKQGRARRRSQGDLGSEQSRFFAYEPAGFDRMRYSYEQLAAQAAPRPVVLFTIPRLPDLVAYARERRSPLDEALAAWAETIPNLHFVPLLPALHARYEGRIEDITKEMFLGCDAHWNPTGHRVAAEILLELAGPQLLPPR
jgi:lysophospholipase L1-like esterase